MYRNLQKYQQIKSTLYKRYFSATHNKSANTDSASKKPESSTSQPDNFRNK